MRSSERADIWKYS